MALGALAFLPACTEAEEGPVIDSVSIADCDPYAESPGDTIPIEALTTGDVNVTGHKDEFSNMCKDISEAPILLEGATTNTYRMTFELPGSYPVASVDIRNYLGDEAYQVRNIDIESSLRNGAYSRVKEDVALGEETSIELNVQARFIRIIFDAEIGTGNKGGDYFGFNDVRFTLGEGEIVEPSKELTDPFYRVEDGWTGADGIFSYNLTDGANHIASPFDTLMFIFSDTYIGGVYENNALRKNEVIVNNTLAYYTPQDSFEEDLEFVYEGTFESPGNIYDPDHYIGYHPSNITNGDGLNHTQSADAALTNTASGVMWKSEAPDANTLTFDYKDTVTIDTLHLWNYNGEQETEIGIRTFELYAGETLDAMTLEGTYTLDEASGSAGEMAQEIDVDTLNARYLRIEILSTFEEAPGAHGFGKLLAKSPEGLFLHSEAHAEDYLMDGSENDLKPRLWLQDGVVIDETFYNFPILVKSNPETDFKVHRVGMSKTPIVGERLDYENTEFMDTPLQARTEDGGELFYGAGVLNMSTHPDIDDPYIYIYGYKDLNGRHLSVARVLPEHIEDFNKYEYFDGSEFQPDITQSAMGIEGVSAELSVTHIPSGTHAGRYMLTYMDNTTSGRVVYALSDTPYGPFDEKTLVYMAPEPFTLDGAFTYNAKLHPLLSSEDELVVSYNVNGINTRAMQNSRVYYPRFITIRETK